MKQNSAQLYNTSNRSDSVLMSQSTSNNKQNKVERSLSVIKKKIHLTLPISLWLTHFELNILCERKKNFFFHCKINSAFENLKEFLSKKSVVCLKTFEIKWCCVLKRLWNFTLAFFIVFKTFQFEFVCVLRANDLYKGKFKTIDLFCKCKLQKVIYIIRQHTLYLNVLYSEYCRYFF